jgi:adenine deaminase
MVSSGVPVKSWTERTRKLLAVARGDAPADLVLTNLNLVDLVMKEIRPAEIALAGARIAAVGQGLSGRKTMDLQGLYVCPGLIDAHVHLESSMLRPCEFARTVVPHGVTTVIGNPHEIANVSGVDGIRFMLEDARQSSLDVLLTVPSCVPATELAGAGAVLGSEELTLLLKEPGVVGLGEVMDFHGVIRGQARLLRELELAANLPVDGHAPGLAGADLAAYAATGISSDHECVTLEQARARLRCGMKVFLREGSAARNLKALLPLVTCANERWLALCTDDREPADLLEEGSIDHLVRMAIRGGVDPLTVLRMASLNAAQHYRLYDRGVIAPGRRADLVAFEKLEDFRPRLVWQKGDLVAENGLSLQSCGMLASGPWQTEVENTVHIDWSQVDLRIPARGRRVRVIVAMEGQLVTGQQVEDACLVEGEAVADVERDLLKIAVVERHRASGRCGLGFVRGLGLRQGALVSTVAHDHHNLLVVGADDRSMMTAARAVAESGGGQAVALGDAVLAHLALPLGGLMAKEAVEKVARKQKELRSAARRLGCSLQEPFMALSFLGLEVIPELKITDFGLVDVSAGRIAPLFCPE